MCSNSNPPKSRPRYIHIYGHPYRKNHHKRCTTTRRRQRRLPAESGDAPRIMIITLLIFFFFYADPCTTDLFFYFFRACVLAADPGTTPRPRFFCVVLQKLTRIFLTLLFNSCCAAHHAENAKHPTINLSPVLFHP